MNKILDLNKSVYELCTEYPELKDVMAGIGFKDIAKPMALNTVGRVMTIPKGASIKDMDLAEVIKSLGSAGFSVTYGEAESAPAAVSENAQVSPKVAQAAQSADSADERLELLKSYITRLSGGEDLESVRKDFVANFSDVDAVEIARAEQSLISGGTPVAEVQKLCDVHSALFHGATREEKIANAEKEVMNSLNEENAAKAARAKELAEKAGAVAGGRNSREAAKSRFAEVVKEEGHPLQILTAENDAIAKAIEEARAALDADHDTAVQKLTVLRAISSHYSKKGDLIYPLLKTKYEVSGPSDVMWGVDDEIRDEIRILCGDHKDTDEWKDKVSAVLTRADEMIYKESNILYPICLQFFAEEEWPEISREIPNYEPCLIDGYPEWSKAGAADVQMPAQEGEIVLPGGHFTIEQLTAVLNTIPMEITFVDENNLNCFFNEGEKLFKRPQMALGREVFSCHPPKIEGLVRGIISDFREGKRDSVEIWHTMQGEPVLVRYMAVRDKDGKYVGTMECVQKMGFAKEHFEK